MEPGPPCAQPTLPIPAPGMGDGNYPIATISWGGGYKTERPAWGAPPSAAVASRRVASSPILGASHGRTSGSFSQSPLPCPALPPRLASHLPLLLLLLPRPSEERGAGASASLRWIRRRCSTGKQAKQSMDRSRTQGGARKRNNLMISSDTAFSLCLPVLPSPTAARITAVGAASWRPAAARPSAAAIATTTPRFGGFPPSVFASAPVQQMF